MSQLAPNPVQGGLSQFLSWMENNSHRLSLHQGEMENAAWTWQADLDRAGAGRPLKPVPRVAESDEIPGAGPDQWPAAAGHAQSRASACRSGPPFPSRH